MMPCGTKDINAKDKSQLIILCIGFFAFLIPAQYAIGATLFTVWQLAICAVSIFSLIYLIARSKLTIRWFAFSAFFIAFFLFSTFLSPMGDTSLKNCLYYCIRGVGFATFLEYAFSRNPTLALRAFIISCTVMCAIYLASFFVYCDVEGGMRSGWVEASIEGNNPTTQNWYFLTYDNASISYFLPLLTCLLYYARNISKNAYRVFWPLLVLVMYSYLVKTSAMAILAVALFLCYIAYDYKCAKSNKAAKFSYGIAVALGMLCNILVVILVGSSLLDSFSAFFGKDGTISGRDLIWARSLEHIAESPITGFGYLTGDATVLMIGQTHCHNLVLQFLFTGGVVTFAAFLWCLFVCRPDAEERNNSLKRDRTASLFNVLFFIMLVVYAIDYSTMTNHLIVLIMYLISFSDKLPRMGKSAEHASLPKSIALIGQRQKRARL